MLVAEVVSMSDEAAAVTNTVTLQGRLSSAPVSRELPSGDVIISFRVVLPRSRTTMTAKSKQASDWVDCVAWNGRVRRTVAVWQVGDVVAIEGALRRRFFRGESRMSTCVEVEVLSARRLERSP
jgi:single-strand DNA-binding protein